MRLRVRLYGTAGANDREAESLRLVTVPHQRNAVDGRASTRAPIAAVTVTDSRECASFAPVSAGASAKFFLESVESENHALLDRINAVLRRDAIAVSRSTASKTRRVRTRGDRSVLEPYGTTAYWLAAIGRLEAELPVQLDANDWTNMVGLMEEAAGRDAGAVTADDAQVAGAGADGAPWLPSDWLAVLAPDPIKAEWRYQDLLRQLTRFFEWERKHDDPEWAAQETMVRGLRRLAAGADTSGKGPRAYLFGVAKLIIKEGWRTRAREGPLDPEAADRIASADRGHAQVEAQVLTEQVLGQLPERERQILTRYVTDTDHTAQCRELNVSANNLRQIVFRIREEVRSRSLAVTHPDNPGKSRNPA